LNRISYSVLTVAEVLAIMVIALLLILPIQDYALREFKEYLRNPSSETSAAFRQKQQEEPLLRLAIVAPFAAAALLIGIPLLRYRQKSRKSN
jgi:membrane protein YdbS with pleckstrin-like domain